MAKQIKQDTIIGRRMEQLLALYGVTGNTKMVEVDDGVRVNIIAPNHLGTGYIELYFSTEVWDANLKRTDPLKVSRVSKVREQREDGSWGPVMRSTSW